MDNIKSVKSNNKSREFWRDHIQRWESEALSQPEYCKQANIKYATFIYWRSILKSESLPVQEKKFVVVKIAGDKALKTMEPPKSIQIKLVSGHIVYIPANMNMKDIAILINGLGVPHA